MKVLVINGSPRGDKSNSFKLTGAFLDGMGQELERLDKKIEKEILNVNRLDIRPCLGCFSCWNRTPGECCIRDDMQHVIKKLLWADVVIWSFPLYYFNVPGGLKNLIDRQLPMVLPFMTERKDGAGNGSHPGRYDRSGQRNVIISTCGFYTAEKNYDGVCSLFDHMCGQNQYTCIFCGQGELFRVKELSQRTDEYLGYVRQAGKEFVTGEIRENTREKLEQLLYPKEVFESMADASWGIDKENGEQESEALIFTRQMAALYKKDAYPGQDLVLEMYYTDRDECYQIVLEKERSRVLKDNSRSAATRIETPFTVWCAIARGEIRGDEALMQGKYRVKGNFDLLLHWDEYFGSAGGSPEKQETGDSRKENRKSIHVPSKGTNMNIMLLPWIVFWVAASIDGYAGSLVSIAVCAAVPLIYYRHKKTFYDVLSCLLVTGFSIVLLVGAEERVVIPLAYLSFGIMWTVSCFLKIPLTAHYSMNNYNGESALENPLFIKTNWILTLMWGILYLITPVWTWFLMDTAIASFTGAVNSILPVLMGIFTAWFQKWYPAKVARG